LHAVSCTSAHKPTIPSTVPHLDIILRMFISDFVILPQDHQPTINGRKVLNTRITSTVPHI
jgi:hypothetical protein